MDPEVALELVQILNLYREWSARKGRKHGVHPINAARKEKGQFHTLVGELRQDADRFRRYTRMSLAAFDKLLGLLEEKLAKHSRREAISREQRLIIALRFLSSGDSFHALSTNFCVGISTASSIVHEHNALVETLASTYLVSPATTAEWLEIADGFCGKWQLPNALGAIDGKHIAIRAPGNSGSLYFNYKQFFSTVLLVVADHRSRILYAHFGSYGHESDAGIFDRSDFHRLINDAANPLNLPFDEQLPGTDRPVPYFFIGDGAFPLQRHIMKPYGQRNLTDEKRIYNYSEMVRYADNYRRRVIQEVHVRARVIWVTTESGFHSSGAGKYAFDGIACRLHLFRTLHDALYCNAAAEDLRRMWRQWVRSFYAYKMRRTSRKPKFYAELSFLNELSMDQLGVVASKY